MFQNKKKLRVIPLLFALSIGFVAFGCEQKEKIVDIETPGANVQIDRSNDTGEVDVKVTH